MRDHRLWTLHVAAGVLILGFGALHMAVMHLDVILGLFSPAGGHPIDWANVMARGRTLFFTLSYVVLLGAALFHGFYGLRNILVELWPTSKVRATSGWLLAAAGLALFLYGTWAAWAGFQVASAS